MMEEITTVFKQTSNTKRKKEYTPNENDTKVDQMEDEYTSDGEGENLRCKINTPKRTQEHVDKLNTTTMSLSENENKVR